VEVDGGNLKIESVGKGELPLFSFLEFRFFWNSPNREAIPMLFGNPAWLAPLIAVPYMLAALVYNFGGAKYFIREENEVVGTVIMKVRQDSLIVKSLAVSPIKRKRGVGFFILVQAEKIAKQMRLPWLELDALKRNVSAQRLYWKFGFRIYAERRLTLVLRKRV
jgi:GNAT superfamily N-acetyltransferase